MKTTTYLHCFILRLSLSLFALYCLILSTDLQAQENTSSNLPETLNVYPVSPEAASLGKYGDLPVMFRNLIFRK